MDLTTKVIGSSAEEVARAIKKISKKDDTTVIQEIRNKFGDVYKNNGEISIKKLTQALINSENLKDIFTHQGKMTQSGKTILQEKLEELGLSKKADFKELFKALKNKETI